MNPSEWLNLGLWVIPFLLAVRLSLRAPPGRRAAWFVVAICCGGICADKVVDLQMILFSDGKSVFKALAEAHPVLQENKRWIKMGLLGFLFLAGVGGTLFLIRRDEDLSPPKWMGLGGLILVMAFVAARLMPGLRGHVASWIGMVSEGVALVLVTIGLLLGQVQNRAGREGSTREQRG
jgi:hypothetical protein